MMLTLHIWVTCSAAFRPFCGALIKSLELLEYALSTMQTMDLERNRAYSCNQYTRPCRCLVDPLREDDIGRPS
jgi:hypothetical protein